MEASDEGKRESELKNKLFEELRKERKRIAIQKNIPVYIIFDNRTLTEMAEVMPESEMIMLQITGVGPAKYQMYGAFFIKVIRKFKSNVNKNTG